MGADRGVHLLDPLLHGSDMVQTGWALARALGLRVIAEGVETTEQMNVLYSLGCHICQGFLFARPMPAAQIATWLNDVLNADGLPRVSESLTLPPVSTLS